MSSRKSFIIHKDSLSVLDDLDDEQAGRLFRAIRAYHEGVEMSMDALTKIAFSPFRSQFERDAEKYDSQVKRNRNNGLKGGRPKTEGNQEEPKKPTGLNENPENPQKGDSDSDSGSGSGSGSGSEKKVPSTKGSRLSEDWVMPNEWIEWATSEMSLTEQAAKSESDRFCDYWMAQAGAKGVKANWNATWRNWVRSAIDRNPAIVSKQQRTRREFGAQPV